MPRPHLTLSLLYPAKSLIQQLMEDNQCPSHLSLSSSLLLISSLKGDQLVHFFHDNIAEASHLLVSQIQILRGNFLDGCVVEFSYGSFLLWSLGSFSVVLLSSHCICTSSRRLSSCVRSWLPWICLFTLTLLHLASCLVFKRRLSELFSTHSQMSYAISALLLQDILNII